MKFIKLLFILLLLFLPFIFKPQELLAACNAPSYCDSPPGSCQPGTCDGGATCIIGDFSICNATGQDPRTTNCCTPFPYPCCTPLDGGNNTNPPTDPPGPPPGWGGCGSCSGCGGPTSECVTPPWGGCQWDTNSCRAPSAPPGGNPGGGPGSGGCTCPNNLSCTDFSDCGGGYCGPCHPNRYPTSTGGCGEGCPSPTQRLRTWCSCANAACERGGYAPPCLYTTMPAYRIRQSCFVDPSCGTCEIEIFPPGPITTQEDLNNPVIVNVTNGSVDRITFNVADESIATVNPTEFTSPPYQTNLESLNFGTTTLVAQGYILNGGNYVARCTSQVELTVLPRAAWWQVNSGKVYTAGSIESLIPVTTCLLPGCNPIFNTNTNPDPIFYSSGSADFSAEDGDSGTVSSTGWLAQTGYLGTNYSYEVFESLVPANTTFTNLSNPTVTGAALTVLSGDYSWFKTTGNLEITSTVNLNNHQVILFVNGDLTIDSNILSNNSAGDFFMAIVNGSINIDPSVTELNGIFFADSQFLSGPANQDIAIHGSVVAGNVSLQRDLGLIRNETQPSEIFEYSEELMLNYPTVLSPKRLIWREVAP